jgi:hypothetical protein
MHRQPPCFCTPCLNSNKNNTLKNILLRTEDVRASMRGLVACCACSTGVFPIFAAASRWRARQVCGVAMRRVFAAMEAAYCVGHVF